MSCDFNLCVGSITGIYVFHQDEFYSYLNSWEESVWKITLNDTDIDYELLNFRT